MSKTLFKPVAYDLSQLLGDIDLGKLALPELQRPFVWDKSKVRDLFDSMYRGFPIGYLMLWSTTEVDGKVIGEDGKQHTPTSFIVDGQQRLTSLYAVMKGQEVINDKFQSGLIEISFRPRDETFAVRDAAIDKDPEFLSSITELWIKDSWEVIDQYVEDFKSARPGELSGEDKSHIKRVLNRVAALQDYPFQAVEIGHEIHEDLVAEIFLRVNSGGTKLTQADFILTLLSVFREEDRRRLEEFAKSTSVVPKKGEASPYNHLIHPDPDSLLRVAALVAFSRGRLQSVLALLRGAGLDGDGAVGEEERTEQLDRLSEAIDQALDLTCWHEYLKVLMSAGFRRSQEISSGNNAILVYGLYLFGLNLGLSHSELRTPIARYFFMSSLTGRYTGSFESQITGDIQTFSEAASGAEFVAALDKVVDNALTSDFWKITLPDALSTAAAQGPGLYGYAAALCLLDAKVPPFASPEGDGKQKAGIHIRDLFDPAIQAKKQPVERHHLFPKAYLQKMGIKGTRDINQIANMSYVEWPENLEISDTAPSEYWPKVAAGFSESDMFHHALPDAWDQMEYAEFLDQRRKLMAKVIRKGFESIGAPPGGAQESDAPQDLPDASHTSEPAT